MSERVGMVIGTEDSTPLAFWVGVAPDAYLQLDDPVIVETDVPGKGTVRIAGIVEEVRARHEGTQFDSDVFLVDRGVLPVETAVAAISCASSASAARIKRCSRSSGASGSSEASHSGSNTRSRVATRSAPSLPPTTTARRTRCSQKRADPLEHTVPTA